MEEYQQMELLDEKYYGKKVLDYSYQDLRGVDFRNQNLEGANFTGANLEGADFTGARLEGAMLPMNAPSIVKGLNASKLKQIKNCEHGYDSGRGGKCFSLLRVLGLSNGGKTKKNKRKFRSKTIKHIRKNKSKSKSDKSKRKADKSKSKRK